jgi:hypothetical protein
MKMTRLRKLAALFEQRMGDNERPDGFKLDGFNGGKAIKAARSMESPMGPIICYRCAETGRVACAVGDSAFSPSHPTVYAALVDRLECAIQRNGDSLHTRARRAFAWALISQESAAMVAEALATVDALCIGHEDATVDG